MADNAPFGAYPRYATDASGNVTGVVGPHGVNIPINRILPKIIGHKGAGEYVAPENSISGYKQAVATGLINIEQDVHLLADGGLGCMHDSTIDATTSGTGNIADLNTAGFKALSMDINTWFAPARLNEPPPLFNEAIHAIAPHGRVLWPEAKNTGSGAVIVANLLLNRISPELVVVQSAIIDELYPAISAGYKAAYVTSSSAADFSALAAIGVTHVIHSNWELADVIKAHAAGIKAVIYTINRQIECDAWLEMGLDFIFSDDPLWVSRMNMRTTRDPFASQTWPSGMIKNYDRGKMLGDSTWGYDVNGTYASALQGWACPINGNPNQPAFTISFDFIITSSTDENKWIGVFACAENDTSFTDSGTNYVNGYHFLIRKNGYLQIYKVSTGGVATYKLAEVAGTSLSTDTTYTAVITVTDTTITLAIPALSRTVSIADTSRRGGYFHMGKSGISVKYSNVSISVP